MGSTNITILAKIQVPVRNSEKNSALVYSVDWRHKNMRRCKSLLIHYRTGKPVYAVDPALFPIDRVHSQSSGIVETLIFTSDPRVSVRNRPGPVPSRLGTKEFLGNAENWKFPLFQNSNACGRLPRPGGQPNTLKIMESSRCMQGDYSLVSMCGVDCLGQGVNRAYCVQ